MPVWKAGRLDKDELRSHFVRQESLLSQRTIRLLSYLCEQGLAVDVNDFKRTMLFTQHFEEDDLENYVNTNATFLRLECKNISNKNINSSMYLFMFIIFTVQEGKKTLRLSSDLSICDEYYTSQECSREKNCRDLHICKFFVLSQCVSKDSCIYGHSLTSPHNERVLRRHHLIDLRPEHIKVIVKNNR